VLALAPPVPGLSAPGAQAVVVGPLISRLAHRGSKVCLPMPALLGALTVAVIVVAVTDRFDVLSL